MKKRKFVGKCISLKLKRALALKQFTTSHTTQSINTSSRQQSGLKQETVLECIADMSETQITAIIQ